MSNPEFDFILWAEHCPAKGRELIVIDDKNVKHKCYRCTCHSSYCLTLRTTAVGDILINPVKWKYN